MKPAVTQFCGDCHAMPRPASSTLSEWPAEVRQGFTLYKQSGRNDLILPDENDVLKYFQYQAPQEFELPDSLSHYPLNDQFKPHPIHQVADRPAGVTHVRWADLGIHPTNALILCDVGTGRVRALWPAEPGEPSMLVGSAFQPVHSEVCDLDADGHLDVVVADIGEFNANDSDLGRVIWFRRVPGEERFEKKVLLEGLSRVSDVRAADFDSDGDLDLLVSVFGWRLTGQVLLIEQTDAPNSAGSNMSDQFVARQLDPRHGAVNSIPIDLNQDGNLDFVTLFSQGYEVVESFLGDGKGGFQSQVLWAAPDPAYGSSGIELVDLDQDSDMDVLYTNGDSFDRGPKLHHSVQWLENKGQLQFEHHHLLQMPGVLNAVAADFDSDGDQDIVAASLLAVDVNDQLMGRNTSSVVYLQQYAAGKFKPFQIEAEWHHHISIEPGDFDGNGTIDFAVGTFLRDGLPQSPELVLWMNSYPVAQ